MPPHIWIVILVVYLIVANIVAVCLTIHDKRMAVRHRYRVPEKVLLLWAALSGCVLMYVTMHLIHHKTQKPKFMVGIPVIFVFELAAIVGILYLSGH